MNPQIQSRWGRMCPSCDKVLITPNKPWPTPCQVCGTRTHIGCMAMAPEWAITLDVNADENKLTHACGKCRVHAANNLRLINMIPQASGGSQFDVYRKWKAQQPPAPPRSVISLWGDYMVDPSNFVPAVSKVLDIVHNSGPKVRWSVKLGQWDQVPMTNLASKEIILPNYYDSPNALGRTHEEVLDAMTGAAMHEAGHAAYDTVETMIAAQRRIKQAPGQSTWASATCLNIVCDYNLERRVVERYPAFKHYFTECHRWSVRDALPKLVNEIQQNPDAENQLNVRLAIVVWEMLGPGDIEHAGGTLTPKLKWITAKCFEILKYAYQRGYLHKEEGKLKTARAIYELVRVVDPIGAPPSQGTMPPPPPPGGQGQQPQPQPGGFPGQPGQGQGQQPGQSPSQDDDEDPQESYGGTGSAPSEDQKGTSSQDDNQENEPDSDMRGSSGTSSGSQGDDSGADDPGDNGSGEEPEDLDEESSSGAEEGPDAEGPGDSDPDGDDSGGSPDADGDSDDGDFSDGSEDSDGSGDEAAESDEEPEGPEAQGQDDDDGDPDSSSGSPDHDPDNTGDQESPAPGPDLTQGDPQGGKAGSEADVNDPFTGKSDLQDDPTRRSNSKKDALDDLEEANKDQDKIQENTWDDKFVVDQQFDKDHRAQSEQASNRPEVDHRLDHKHNMPDKEIEHAARIRELAPITSRLKKVLRFRNVDWGGRQTGRRSGTLTRRHVNRLSTLGSDKVFHRTQPDATPKVRIALLIDESESMRHLNGMTVVPYQGARNAATALTQALHGIRGVKVWSWGYSMSPRSSYQPGAPRHVPQLRQYVDPFHGVNPASIETHPMMGGTPTGEAMDYAAEVIHKNASPDEKLIVFVITDGEAGGYMSTATAVRKWWGKVTFVHVGIGKVKDDSIPYYIGPVLDVALLPELLNETVSEILR